jgi:hypothetical protein
MCVCMCVMYVCHADLCVSYVSCVPCEFDVCVMCGCVLFLCRLRSADDSTRNRHISDALQNIEAEVVGSLTEGEY